MTFKLQRFFIFLGSLASLIIACLGIETRYTNHIGWIVFFIGLLSCAAGLLYLGISTFKEAFKHGSPDCSLWLILPGMVLIGLVPPLEYLFLTATLPRSDLMQDVSLIIFMAGLPLFLWSVGMVIWWDAVRPYETVGDRSILKGMNRSIHYPGYAGLGLIALSLCLGFSSLIGLLAFLALFIPGMIYRLWKENQNWPIHEPHQKV